MPVELLTVGIGDGASVEARVFKPAAAPARALLFMPALGTPPRLYDAFGEGLAAHGIGVLVGEHRGGVASTVRPARGVDFDYAEMFERDWPPLERAVADAFPGAVVSLGGHSFGAHLAAIRAGAGLSGKLVIVAAGSTSPRAWPLSKRFPILAAGYLFPVLGTIFGYHPGELVRFGGRQARSVMLDWSRENRTGRFSSRGGSLDLEAQLNRNAAPVLAVGIRGDTLSPPESMGLLLSRMPRASVVRREVPSPAEPTRLDPHFRWARAPEAVTELVAVFLNG